MAGLVSNMEVAGSRAQSATPPANPPSSLDAAKHMALVRDRVAAAQARRPIVLTPHAVVHTVAAPATTVYSGGSGYSAPVAKSGGSGGGG